MAARERYDTRDESIIVPSGERKNGGQTQKHRRTQRFTDNPVDTFLYAQKRGTSDCCKLYLYLRKESGKQAQWVLGRRGVRIEPVESACGHGLIGADWQRGGTLVGSPRLEIQQLSLFLISPPYPPRYLCRISVWPVSRLPSPSCCCACSTHFLSGYRAVQIVSTCLIFNVVYSIDGLPLPFNRRIDKIILPVRSSLSDTRSVSPPSSPLSLILFYHRRRHGYTHQFLAVPTYQRVRNNGQAI